jgi:hypothetical protein
MSDSIEPGGYILKKCSLSNHDGTKTVSIGDMINTIEIEEDISKVCIQGFITITDAVNIIDNFPIIGEEILTLEVEDFYEEVVTYQFHVYAIDTLATNNTGTMQVYVLRIYSKDFIKSESVEISLAYRGKISESVKSIYDEHFISNKVIEIEETLGEQAFVVPNLTPIETILMMASKSFSDVYKSSNFVFFERKDKYFFGTHEKLFEDGQETKRKYLYSSVNSDIEDRAEQMNKIQAFSLNKRMNLLEEMRSGAAISRVIKLDLATKSYENLDYKHYERVKDYKHTDSVTKDYHSEAFNKEFFGEDNITNDYVVFQDSTRQDQQSYQDIVSQRLSTSYYLNSIAMYIKIYGANNINVGDLIRFELQDLSSANDYPKNHATLSGLYMVSTIKSVYDGTRWDMTIGLLKDSLKGEGAE